MDSYEVFAGLFAAMAGFMAIIGIVGIVFYVIMALGLMTMANNKGIENAWLAWIPIANLWIIGKIVETIEFGDRTFENAPMIMLGAFLASMFLSWIPLIGFLISIASAVIFYLAIYKIYKMYAPENATLYLVLSIIFAGIAMPIIFFKLKDESPVAA